MKVIYQTTAVCTVYLRSASAVMSTCVEDQVKMVGAKGGSVNYSESDSGQKERSRSLFSMDGKTALVTGGSRGIGYMIAQGLLQAGVRVYICARKDEELSRAIVELSRFGQCRGLAVDLSDPPARERLVRWVGEEESFLNVLVNNAGTNWGAPIEEFPLSGFDKVLTLNLVAPFDLIRLALPMMRAAATPGDPARVINIGSIDGVKVPLAQNYSYSASKAGIHMLSRHLARHLVAENITVNTIAAGVFETKMTKHWFDPNHPGFETRPAIPMERPGGADDIAAAAIYLAARSGAYVTGITLPVAGGIGTID